MNKLLKKIKTHTANVGVIGLGYVGLPLSVELARTGFKVMGFDISEKKVDLLNSGCSDIDDIADEQVKEVIDSGNFCATDEPKLLGEMNIIVICVPTPLSKTKSPDVSYILSAMKDIQKYIKKGSLVILESTTYPGTTEELLLPMLEVDGKKVGKDFFLAFSPERLDPCNSVYGTQNTPRILGGITDRCTRVSKSFYEQIILEVHTVSTTRAAEMVKLLENTFRSVNIGLVNEVAQMCDRLGINVWEIVDAAATKPFGFMPFYPGPGVGGHCISIDPRYLSWKLKSLNYYARFIELAGEINIQMPKYVVQKINNILNDKFACSINKTTICVLGVAYKKDIKDVRESPALDVIKLLEDSGAKVIFNDPFVEEVRWNGATHKSHKLTKALLKKSKLTVILTDHTKYDYQFIVENSDMVFDTRNVTKDVVNNRDRIELL